MNQQAAEILEGLARTINGGLTLACGLYARSGTPSHGDTRNRERMDIVSYSPALAVVALLFCIVHPAAAFQPPPPPPQQQQAEAEQQRQLEEVRGRLAEEAARLINAGRAEGIVAREDRAEAIDIDIDRSFWDLAGDVVEHIGEMTRRYAEQFFDLLRETKIEIDNLVCRARVESVTVGTEVSVTVSFIEECQ